MAETYPILQSGFIGLTEKGLRRPDPIGPSFRDAVIFKEVKSPLAKFRFSPTIKQLFVEWNSKPELLRDFDFRERILDAAYKSFGTYNLFQWLTMQSEKPTISELHARFLYETLDFLMGDTPRSIDQSSWLRLIEADEKPVTVRLDFKKYFKSDVNSNEISYPEKLPTKLEGIIQRWVTKERGFEDLLLSLFVIFGDRAARTAVTKETT